MKVLHLVLSVSPRWGGLAWATLHLSRAQREQGCRSGIWCLDVYPLDAVGAEERRAVLASTRVFDHTPPARLGHSRSLHRAIGSSEGASYDVLHQHGLWRAFSRAAIHWRRTHGRPSVLAPAGTLEPAALAYRNLRKRLALWAYEWANLRGASCLHAHSEKEALGFRRLGLRNPVAVIPSAIPDEWVQTTGNAASFRHRFEIPQDRRVRLFLSRIHPIKGIALLLEALAATRDVGQPWLTVIAGADEDGHLGRMKRLAQELALGQDVRFVGPLYGQDKRDAFAAAELFVLPTHSESFGMVVAEALGAGVPVLTTHAAPWAELSTHGCGWQVETSVAAIAQGLLDATRHSRAELADMGRRGRQLVHRRYTWSRVAEQTVALYEWLLDRRGRPDFVSLD